MTFEILKKAGYKIDSTDNKLVVTSSRRLSEFITAMLLTLVIIYMVISARLNDSLLLRTIQYIIFSTLIVGPFILLLIQWKHRIIIQKGRVQISRMIKGYIDYYKITSIDLETEQSWSGKRVTVLVNDMDNGLKKLFVFYVKTKQLEQLNDFLNHIREFIGLQTKE